MASESRNNWLIFFAGLAATVITTLAGANLLKTVELGESMATMQANQAGVDRDLSDVKKRHEAFEITTGQRLNAVEIDIAVLRGSARAPVADLTRK